METASPADRDALAAAVLCGRAAEAAVDGFDEQARELYQDAIATGDPEWAPFAALVLGNLLIEACRCGEAEAAFRVAVASGHEVFASSPAHHLANLCTREDDDESPGPLESDGRVLPDDMRHACGGVPEGRPTPAQAPRAAAADHRRRAGRKALAGGICLASALTATVLHADEVGVRAAQQARSVSMSGVVIDTDYSGGYLIRYFVAGEQHLLRVDRRWPDGADRGYLAGRQITLLADPQGATPIDAADLDHREKWYEPGVVVLLLAVGGSFLLAAAATARRWRLAARQSA